jgi:hypothetical protein
MPFVPPTFQGDYFDPVTATRLAAPTPWWLNYPRPPTSSVPAVTLAPAPSAVTPRLPGGWTSAFGYVSPANWPAS